MNLYLRNKLDDNNYKQIFDVEREKKLDNYKP